MSNEIKSLAILYANRIGSPWGEGATYDHEQAEAKYGEEPKPNGKLYSHLDDQDFEAFVSDLTKDISELIDQALTAYKKNLLSKAIPVAALRTKDKEFEQIQAIPVSAIEEDEVE